MNPLIFIVTHGTTAVAVIAVFYLYGMAFNARVRAVATSMFIAFMVSGISVQLLKHLIGRARPRLSMTPLFLGPTIQPGFDSFPSGHTTVTFCMAYVLSQRVPRYRALYFAFAFFTALDRILGLAHFLSDVAAGIALGLAAGILVSEFIRPEGSPDGIFSKKTNPYPAAPNTDGPERSNAL
ncbi:MAG: phosphatase PAP2 family protein [Nitrospirae bacterium]|nr:phosphatase PAP2 family protein [Nitrospirota bacterium]